MTSLNKTTLFKVSVPRAETQMDKTSRAVREILDDETDLRSAKTDRLRKARIEREAFAQVNEPKRKQKPAGKALQDKAAK